MHRGGVFKALTLILLIVVIGTECDRSAVATPATRRVREDYSTIQAAINAANPGDTILVAAGTYSENLLVNKSVSIIGENPATTIIDGGGLGTVVTIPSTNVVINGFTVQNGKRELPYSGISIYMCNFAVINNTVLRKNYYGLQLTNSNVSKIFNNVIMNNSYVGIKISEGNNNVFFENTIKDNFIGLWSSGSASNNFYHNNFVNNTDQLRIYTSPTTWDNGAEGNYWSDYMGSDTDLDGVGDSQYLIAGDRYPLMGMFTNFTVQYESQTYFLSIICNSTISNFQFDKSNGKISFDVSGPNGTVGFFRIASPTTLIHNKYSVYIDDKAPPYIRNWTVSTYIYGYLLYLHTDVPQRVTVALDLPKSELPPFLVPTLVATILTATALTIIIFMKRKTKVK